MTTKSIKELIGWQKSFGLGFKILKYGWGFFNRYIKQAENPTLFLVLSSCFSNVESSFEIS